MTPALCLRLRAMRRLHHAITLLAAVSTLSGCGVTTEPGAAAVRGLSFVDSIPHRAMTRLERIATIHAVVQSAKVVLIESDASVAVLQQVPGVVEVGPLLGPTTGLQLEASVLFPDTPTAVQLAAVEDAGVITGTLPEVHWYILLVPFANLPRLDRIAGARDITLWVNHVVRCCE